MLCVLQAWDAAQMQSMLSWHSGLVGWRVGL
jgi:hypothetical protein